MLVASLLILTLCAAASFTKFPNFQGNREKLEKLLAAAGTLVDDMPPEATSLDDLFSHDLLVAMFKALPSEVYQDFGALLEDLSPRRFDELCNEIQHYERWFTLLVVGYPQMNSKWKLHLNSCDDLQNRNFYYDDCMNTKTPRRPRYDYVEKMADHPDEIFDHSILVGCLNLWAPNEKKHDLVREACLKSTVLRNVEANWLLAFEGHEGDYIAMLKGMLKRDKTSFTFDILIPPGISLEQLQPLAEHVESCSVWRYSYFDLEGHKPDVQTRLVELNRAAEKKRLRCNGDGVDTEPFLGEWPTGEIFNGCAPAKLAFPKTLFDASNDMIYTGNETVLQNSLAFASQWKTPLALYTNLIYWLEELDHFTPRVKKVFAMFKPFLTVFDINNIPLQNWRLLPLYEDMVDNPDDYWREEIKEAATAWASEYLNTSKVGIEDNLRNADAGDLIRLAADPYWRERALSLLKERIDTIDWDSLSFRVTVERVAVLADLWMGSTPSQREAIMRLVLRLFRNAHSSMVLTANTRLLDQFLKMISPQEMLSRCTHQLLEKRLNVMLHLNPNVDSYHNGALINKNSVMFRDWVFAVLPCTVHRITDLKLLDYYFNNRIHAAYYDFEIHPRDAAGDCAFGLLGNPNKAIETEKLIQLTFLVKGI